MQKIMYAAAIAAVLSVVLLAIKTTEAIHKIEESQINQGVKIGMHYIIKGKEYRAADPVSFDIAEEYGGFYYSRARWLGLSEPPAAIVANPPEPTAVEARIITDYHDKFKQAEYNMLIDDPGTYQ